MWVAEQSLLHFKLDQIIRLLKDLKRQGGIELAAIDNLRTEVTALQGAAASAKALLEGLHQMLLDAIAAGDPNAVQAVADQIHAMTDDLASAVAANPLPTP